MIDDRLAVSIRTCEVAVWLGPRFGLQDHRFRSSSASEPSRRAFGSVSGWSFSYWSAFLIWRWWRRTRTCGRWSDEKHVLVEQIEWNGDKNNKWGYKSLRMVGERSCRLHLPFTMRFVIDQLVRTGLDLVIHYFCFKSHASFATTKTVLNF